MRDGEIGPSLDQKSAVRTRARRQEFPESTGPTEVQADSTGDAAICYACRGSPRSTKYAVIPVALERTTRRAIGRPVNRRPAGSMLWNRRLRLPRARPPRRRRRGPRPPGGGPRRRAASRPFSWSLNQSRAPHGAPGAAASVVAARADLRASGGGDGLRDRRVCTTISVAWMLACAMPRSFGTGAADRSTAGHRGELPVAGARPFAVRGHAPVSDLPSTLQRVAAIS